MNEVYGDWYCMSVSVPINTLINTPPSLSDGAPSPKLN